MQRKWSEKTKEMINSGILFSEEYYRKIKY